MRTSLLGALFAIALASHGAGAQRSGFGVGALFSYVLPDPIYDKTTLGATGDLQLDRLSLGAAPAIGARIAYRFGEVWAVSAEASRGSASYEYLVVTPFSQSRRTGGGSVSTMLLSVDRTVARTGDLRLGALLQGGVQRLTVNRDPVVCLPPSLGTPSPCAPAQPWQQAYHVPSVGGGFAVRAQLGERMALDFRGIYSIGRANTRSFWTDLQPALDQYEADRSHWLRVTQLSVGLEIGP
jgi:hypothetical protein